MLRNRFLRFLLSGGLSTVLDFLFFSGLILIIPARAAYPISYSLCVVIRYFIDAQLTFAAERLHWRQFARYFLVNLVVMGFGFLAFASAQGFLSARWAKLASIPVTVVSGFLLMRFWVFAQKREGD